MFNIKTYISGNVPVDAPQKTVTLKERILRNVATVSKNRL